MKSLIVASFLLATTSSFAATCFKAVDAVSKKSQLPEVVCVESYGLDLVIPELPEKPDYKATVVTDLGTIVRENVWFRGLAETFDVTVSKYLVNEGGGCDESYDSALKITFKVSKNAKVIQNELNVSGVETFSHDSCHSSDRVTTTRYEKI